MTVDDVGGALAVVADATAARAHVEPDVPPAPPSRASEESARAAHARFVARDGPGAWVAESHGRVVGVAESIRRGDFWGLSMLFVHPDFQSRGVGRRLIEAGLGYAAGARVRMIQSSPDPRAMRRYALAGLAMHPAVEVRGTPDRRAVPASLTGRAGSAADLDIVAAVEAELGRDRADDAAFLLQDPDVRLDVVDSGGRRGWVLWRAGRLIMLGATDEGTAASLLWRFLAGNDGDVSVSGLTAAQDWAFSVAHAAHLTLASSGAMFVDGMHVPGPWIPSGWYF